MDALDQSMAPIGEADGGGGDVVGRGGAGVAISLDDVGGGAGSSSSSSSTSAPATLSDRHRKRAYTANDIGAQSASAAPVADFTKDEVENWVALAGFGESHLGGKRRPRRRAIRKSRVREPGRRSLHHARL